VHSVETQDYLLDLLSATAGEVAIDAEALEPGLFENPQRGGIVRGCTGEQWAFGGHGKEALERRTGDTSAPERAIDPVGHLGLVVDPEGGDRSGDRSVGTVRLTRAVNSTEPACTRARPRPAIP
jgi:hypothetical protein